LPPLCHLGRSGRGNYHKKPGMAKSENENIYTMPMEITHILGYVGFCVIFYEICHRLKAFYTYLI
jgi:hypothetical protein